MGALLREVEKCDVLCADCHSLKHGGQVFRCPDQYRVDEAVKLLRKYAPELLAEGFT